MNISSHISAHYILTMMLFHTHTTSYKNIYVPVVTALYGDSFFVVFSSSTPSGYNIVHA